jgi:hypothetical protein
MKLGKTHFQKQKCYWTTFKRNSDILNVMRRYAKSKIDGYYREGSYVHEIFCDGRRIVVPKMGFQNNCFWVYKIVINDVKKYLESHKPKRSKRYPSVLWNRSKSDFVGKITATDVDAAYWRIAYLRQYISENTYLRGLDLEDKSMRNSSLSNLNSQKQWFVIEGGQLTEKSFVITKPDDYAEIYDDIRFFCYKLMKDLSLLLGDDFICYKVDCIYYVDNKRNRQIVQGFLNKNKMEWKQLEEHKLKKTIKTKNHEKNNSRH